MSQYSRIADYYDRLTEHVGHLTFAKRIDAIFSKGKSRPDLILDLGCGTATVASILGSFGYDLICCDRSPEMLQVARDKCANLPLLPAFICQDMQELDLFGTVGGVYSCLDSINYLTDLRGLRRTFSAVALFLESGGFFVFDAKSPLMFRNMSGTMSLFEDDEIFCTWQYGYDNRSALAQHQIDLFIKQEQGYLRQTEHHLQRAYTQTQIAAELDRAGFKLLNVYDGYTTKKAHEGSERLLFVAQKQK